MELVNYSEAIADEVGFSKYLDPWNGDASKDLSVKEGQREWRDFICAEPWQRLLIDVNGDVYPCIPMVLAHRLGNVFETSLNDMWNGMKVNELRDHLQNQNINTLCRICSCGVKWE